MKKILVGALIVVILLTGVAYYILAPSKVSPAILYIENGAVEVNTGAGWTAGVNEMELPQGASVRTKHDGTATVVLMEGEILSLQPETEVRLDKITSKKLYVTQLAGETWNKITKLSGIKEYKIQTPSTVATVRGTEFFFTDTELDVGEGEVQYGTREDEQRIVVREHKRALKEKFVEEDMPEETIARMKQFPKRYLKILKQVRARELRKHKFIMRQVKNRGVSEEQIEFFMNELDEGRQDEDEIMKKVPSPLQPKAKRTQMLTKEIKHITQQLKQQAEARQEP
ncbi:MAG: FecR domain-containing protein [Candidatus Aenigmarchaeota archaeon]|nr:FecR domain-containing protein [Candidatus Aenigmarchaeota archaeon]